MAKEIGVIDNKFHWCEQVCSPICDYYITNKVHVQSINVRVVSVLSTPFKCQS